MRLCRLGQDRRRREEHTRLCFWRYPLVQERKEGRREVERIEDCRIQLADVYALLLGSTLQRPSRVEHNQMNCTTCNNTRKVHRSWAAGGGRIGYRSWLEDCPDCGELATAMRQIGMLFGIQHAAKDFEFDIIALGDHVH